MYSRRARVPASGVRVLIEPADTFTADGRGILNRRTGGEPAITLSEKGVLRFFRNS